MNAIFFIIGKTGSGKSTLLKRIREAVPELESIVYHTDRPMRDGEVNGEDYYFVSKERFDTMIKHKDLFEYREYNTVNGLWRYGTKCEIDINNKYFIVQGSVEMYELYIENFKTNCPVIPIVITVNEDDRVRRLLERENAKQNPDLAEMYRRLSTDEIDFRRLEKYENVDTFYNDDLDATANEIIEYINNYIKHMQISWLLNSNVKYDPSAVSSLLWNRFRHDYTRQLCINNHCDQCARFCHSIFDINSYNGLKSILANIEEHNFYANSETTKPTQITTLASDAPNEFGIFGHKFYYDESVDASVIKRNSEHFISELITDIKNVKEDNYEMYCEFMSLFSPCPDKDIQKLILTILAVKHSDEDLYNKLRQSLFGNDLNIIKELTNLNLSLKALLKEYEDEEKRTLFKIHNPFKK